MVAAMSCRSVSPRISAAQFLESYFWDFCTNVDGFQWFSWQGINMYQLYQHLPQRMRSLAFVTRFRFLSVSAVAEPAARCIANLAMYPPCARRTLREVDLVLRFIMIHPFIKASNRCVLVNFSLLSDCLHILKSALILHIISIIWYYNVLHHLLVSMRAWTNWEGHQGLPTPVHTA